MNRLPILYKKTSTGKIQTWEVCTEGATMHSWSGQLEGKKIASQDTIKAGKNIGKANETTREEQAILEAQARWRGKKKKGYVESLSDAGNDVVSDLVEGGYSPTLAHSYDKRGKDIIFPCAGQPKLDGVRSTYTGGNRLWSRTRKEIIGVPHIHKYITSKKIDLLFDKLDGELYKHELKDDFEQIVHIVKQQKTVDPEHEIVEYHVYDIPSNKPFQERIKDLQKLKKVVGKNSPIKVVETVLLHDEEEMRAYEERCLEAGYEGIMLRNLAASYEEKRSKHLQKVKRFEDAEFQIVDGEEGRGKLQGHLGAFFCQTPNGDVFKAKMSGKTAALKDYWEDLDDHIGKELTVQFQGLTGKNSVPRFPVGLRLREAA